MPTYPFVKDRYWLPNIDSINQQTASSVHNLEKTTGTTSLSIKIQQDFIRIIATLLKLKPETITMHIALSELGFDSISFKELAEQLEKYFNITFNPTLFFTYNTIAALSQHVLDNNLVEIQKTYLADATQSPPTVLATVVNTKQNIRQTSIDEIAIIGMQGYFPQSKDLETFWKHLQAGDDLITEIPNTRWEWKAYYGDAKQDPTKTNSKWGGFIADVDKFDANFFNISAREANLMDPQHRLFLEIVWKTIEDAGYDPLALQGAEVGIFAGIEFNEYAALISASQKIFHGHIPTGNSHALLTNRVSYFLNLHGPSESVDTACSSSLVAIHRAVQAIRNGDCGMAIAGGVNLILNPETYVTTSQLGALSSDGRCKTFDKSANGYVKGEGVAAIFLKPLSQAQADNDYIYGVIKSSAVNHGGKAQSLTAPNAVAQSELIIKAYAQANLDPETISYIELHGTGTELGDPVEVEGLKKAFASLRQQQNKFARQNAYCGLGAVKTNIGHLEPASGMAGIIKILLAMQNGIIPGNLHLKELNPYINLTDTPFYIIDKNKIWDKLISENKTAIPRRAGISSFGFGGSNAHLVIEESPHIASAALLGKPAYLITLSAKQEASLKLKISELNDWLKQHRTEINIEALSYTLNVGRSAFPHRCAIVVNSLEELLTTLQLLITDQQPSNCLMNTVSSTTLAEPILAEIYKSTLEALTNYSALPAQIYREKLFILADLYTKNFPLDWQLLHAGENKQRVAGLPTYPFLKQRYWFDAELPTNTILPSTDTTTDTKIDDIHHATLNYLKKIFAEKLKQPVQAIATDVTYEMFGVDSLLGLEIVTRLEQDFGTLPKTILFEKNQLQELAIYLQKRFADKLPNILGGVTPTKPSQNTGLTIASKINNITQRTESITDTQSADIAIIGLSGTFPMADNIQEFWLNLRAGKDCISEVPPERWNYKDYPIKTSDKTIYYNYGGFIPDIDKFDPLFFNIAPSEAAFMDPQERLFLQSAWTTLEDAGYTRERLAQSANNSVGVFAGVTYNFYPIFIAEEWAKGNRLPLDVQTFSIANRISYFLNLRGPSYVIDTACSSALAAIHLACESIRNNECTMAIAGGVNLSLHPAKYHALGAYNFLSLQGRCASFAAGGAGYVPGEGVGSVLLKPLSLALRDQDRIYGIIKSSAMNHGGKTSGYTVPNPNAQAELIKQALAKANIDPRTISYIEAHGTGTALGDPIEIRGLQEAFEEYTHDKQFCAIGSVKSNIGHLESAAGISQLAKVLLQIQHKKLIPSLHAETLNPFIDFPQTPFYVQRELGTWQSSANYPLRAGISSFGAGGTNVHVIVEEFIPDANKKPAKLDLPFILLISAQNADRLHEYTQRIYNFLTVNIPNYSTPDALQEWLGDLCYTSQVGREPMTARLAILAVDVTDLLNKVKSQLESLKPGQNVWVNAAAQSSTDNQVNDLIAKKSYESLLQLWSNGTRVAWEKIYTQQTPKRIFIPTYPFAKRRCWIATQSQPIDIIEKDLPIKPLKLPEFLNDWLYTTRWEKSSIEDQKNTSLSGHWLIFSDNELGLQLRDTLGKENCTSCYATESFSQLNEDEFNINPHSFADYCQVLTKLSQKKLAGIIYLWPLTAANQGLSSSQKLQLLFQALIQMRWQDKLKFGLITRGSQASNETDPVDIWQHYLWSMTRIFGAETSDYQTLLLDLDANKNLSADVRNIMHSLQHYQSNDNHIAYKNNERHVIRLVSYLKNITTTEIAPWTAPETVLITGGLGALGTEVAKWLVTQGTRYLLLTGNTPLPDRSEWPKVHGAALQEKITGIISLESLGAKIQYTAVDVTDKGQMQLAIAQAEKQWKKPIAGVFHIAGITTDNVPINKMSQELLQKVLAVKIQGSLVLHEIFNKTDLHCFVLFSSISATPHFGISGLSAYAMANEFLNGLAIARRQQGLPAMSISWSAWADKGMSFKHNHSAFLDAIGISTIPVTQGIEILSHLLSLQPSNIIVTKILWPKFLSVNIESRKLKFFTYFADQLKLAANKTLTSSRNNEQILKILVNKFAGLLDFDSSEIDVETLLQDYGLDSIHGINFIAKINEDFPDIVSPMDLYRYSTLQQLCNYIVESLSGNSALTEEDKLLKEITELNEDQVTKLIDSVFDKVEKLS